MRRGGGGGGGRGGGGGGRSGYRPPRYSLASRPEVGLLGGHEALNCHGLEGWRLHCCEQRAQGWADF